jgi:uncharacterized protein
MVFDWAITGGLLTGVLAGAAARYGRLCTMSALEDVLIGQDRRGAKAWGLAIASAIGLTQLLAAFGWLDLAQTAYANPQLHVLGALLGGLAFGLGMTLVGTCSFGLLVRAGGGDLRALVAALMVGIFAFAVTAGSLAPLRTPLLTIGVVDVGSVGPAIAAWLTRRVGTFGPSLAIGGIVMVLAGLALADRRLRRRPRMLAGSVALGFAISLGWFVTARAVDFMTLDRPESLSFVAPVGRALLQFMMEPFRNVGFGVAAMCGTLAASAAVALARRELRWEAFDDAREMRRHLFGASLMGIGGVLAQGCTIGQGLSAASTLSLSTPLFLIGVLAGSKLGLNHLIEGRSLWRLGRTSS